jgi:CDGSH-type Zn-finger protein
MGSDMEEPTVADRRPCVQEMEPGTYFWCACGKSATQPFCDGSHKGSAFSPVKHVIIEKSKVAWCMCKHTGGTPRCDGSHARLGEG